MVGSGRSGMLCLALGMCCPLQLRLMRFEDGEVGIVNLNAGSAACISWYSFAVAPIIGSILRNLIRLRWKSSISASVYPAGALVSLSSVALWS